MKFVVSTFFVVLFFGQLTLAQGNPAQPAQAQNRPAGQQTNRPQQANPQVPVNNQQNQQNRPQPQGLPARSGQPTQQPVSNGQPAQKPQAVNGVPAANSPALTPTQVNAMDGLEGLNLKSEALGRRDPFTLPLYLINKLKAKDVGPPVSRVDDSVEPIRRWPLVSYTLVGIIWDVKNSKALIRDQAGHVHILKVRDRIGYDKGVITDIREGSVTVLENEIPQVLKLRK